MNRNNYAGIGSFKELREARQELKVRTEEKAGELKDRYGALRAYYTPSNIFSVMLRNSTEEINWVPLALYAIRRIRSLLLKEE